MRIHSAPAVQAHPNVTPMIDVMLVLLIIFMVVTPALLDRVLLQPPQGTNLTAHPNEEGDQTLSIDAHGEYYLNRRYIPAGDLFATLNTIYVNRDFDRVLYLRADKSVDYSRVIDAMDIASRSGVRVIGMIADKKRVNVVRP